MKYFFVLFLLLLIAAPLDAQGSRVDTSAHVYILVVDDFGDHFGALARQLRSNSSVRSQLQADIQQLPRRGNGGGGNGNGNGNGSGNAGNSFNGNGNNNGSRTRPTPQPTATAMAQLTTLRQSLHQQALQAVTSAVQGNLSQEDCSVVPEGQSFFATSGTSFFATSGTGFFATSGTGSGAQAAQQPHGVRVQTEIQQLVSQYGHGLPIDVVPVDTDGYTTDIITNRIQQTIAQLSATHPNAGFVVNMSFAVVPCSVLPDLAVYDALMHEADADLAGDLDAMQAVFQQLEESGLYNSAPIANDALQGFLNARCRSRRAGACVSGNNQVILVAASGNSSEPFPFYPAAWSGVTAVSASDDSGDFVATAGVRSSYSNAGEILMPGEWGTELGTSFAAPRYSFAMALSLLNQTPSACSAPIAPAPPIDWLNNPPATPDQELC